MNSFNFQNYSVKYLEAGKRTPLIFLHNGSSSHKIWCKQIDYYSKKYHVFAFDLLGFGQSDRPDITYSLDLYVNIIEQFIVHKKLSSTILVGNCIGASIALTLAKRHPHLIDQLVLMNIYGGSKTLKIMKLIEWRIVSPTLAAQLLSIPFISTPETLWAKNPKKDDPLLEYFYDVVEKHPLAIQSRKNLIAGAHTFSTVLNFFSKLKNFPKTLLLWGKNNRAIHVKYGRKFKQILSPDEYYELVECGHLCMHENPEKVNSLIDRFLKSSS
ncbi:MAG: alpha/beta hydrolase [Oligoflexia bacterium]|nr:alpha/beta hydrolase [Oligoflexia bacterium]